MASLILLIACTAVAWVIGLLLWPYAACRSCGGSGKNAGSNRGRWGTCRKCKGSGRRLRTGASLVHGILARRKP
jgi:DnaJ-class molecular chaperone